MTVIWNREMYERLKVAYAEAASLTPGQKFGFPVDPPRPPAMRFLTVKDGQMLTFTRAEARLKLAELAPQFARPDQPARPYHEGTEGQ